VREMLKDRDLKASALRMSVANRWFPQLEVDVHATKPVRDPSAHVTDLDVFASIPDVFHGFRTVVVDCKTRVKESPINRALWLRGVLQRCQADQGICVLKKESIELDHRLLANRLNVILLAEDQFDLYARATTKEYAASLGHTAEIHDWEQFFEIPNRFPTLQDGFLFIRSGYWMIDDAAESCRKILASLRRLSPELDPRKQEHLAVFLDFSSLFARSLAIVVCNLFKAYLHPRVQSDLSEALLVLLYGGREAYEYRNDLYKRVLSKEGQPPWSDNLSLPEWDRFLQLARQLLDAPTEAQRVPLILREVGFGLLNGDPAHDFAKALCSESPQGAKFALLVPGYLCRAARLPTEFGQIVDDVLLRLQPIR
jgi:hypothetical protein